MASDNNDNNSSSSHGHDQPEQDFEALLLSAKQPPVEDYEQMVQRQEVMRHELEAKWTARLVGKAFVEPATEHSCHSADNGNGENKAEAEADADAATEDDNASEAGSDYKGNSDDLSFSVALLPANHRILRGENAPMTMDYRPDRLNVVLDDAGICTKVFFV
ncbi:hypothetical protein GGI04_000717 [Coemansia thaxteri]|uniref:Uncharacterized protein n=1 Tax=Coemansia thaxteri TaxID=2663907 RepID=A0A9W8EL73_9FUNG|nr:hypothetical protein H4R26_000682 [Coemansia thaxteri]KAJ2009116.1 hypothetical protein GGI04_000717 [Coemansia thaxteri]KAJ2474051.1 hypothetical protein GGI02_000397 [Coemansia sp. RSA 2322]KAJ2486924.1 hypothetical protein EV174_000824 [Coemansia sp. RSA 2320]